MTDAPIPPVLGVDDLGPDTQPVAYEVTDGTAYVSYSSEENRSLYIAKLNADYTNVEKTSTTDTVGLQYSADGQYPRIFADGTEGLVRSGIPHGTAALVRLTLITVIALALAARRLTHLRLSGSAD